MIKKLVGRQARLIAGTYHDVVLMDLLAEEFHGHLISDHLGAPTR